MRRLDYNKKSEETDVSNDNDVNPRAQHATPTFRREFLQQSVVAAGLTSLMSAALAQATNAQTAPAKKLDALIVAVQEGDTRTIDPQDASELTVPMFLRAIYDQLLTFPNGDLTRVAPNFATTWDVSSDGLTYVFKLNPNIKFSNGTPATADDVVFSSSSKISQRTGVLV